MDDLKNKNTTMHDIQTKILAFYQIYLKYEDNQSVLDHVRYHKMHHYNNKIEITKKQVVENMPQTLTTYTEYDEVTEYLSNDILFFPISNNNEKRIHKFVLKYFQENYPEHYVRN